MIHKFYKTQSRLATILIGFEAGSKIEHRYRYNYGVAHALEHNIFKHYDGLKTIDVQKKISYLGGSTNAYTSANYVAYYIELPLEHLEEGIKIIKGMVSDVIVDDEDFIKEMEVIKEEEISSRDSVPGFMWNNFQKNYFDNFLSVPVIGTKESISKISKEELQSFHEKFCNFDKSIICISANITKKKAMSLMKDHFGRQSGRIVNTKMKQSKYGETRSLNLTRSDIEHSFVWMCMPNKSIEDFGAEYYLVHSILSSGMDSRLFEEVREKQGLVYSISSSFNNFNYGHFNMFNFQTRKKNKDKVISIINNEISTIQKSGFSEEEITRAKNKARTLFYKATETGSGMVHNEFSAIVNNKPTLDEFIRRIESSTKDDLIYAANIMFDLDKCLTITCEGEAND